MARKRAPDSYLTPDNCDVEEEQEEPGSFKSASEDVLQKRTVLKARRRQQGDSEQPTKNAFAGFSFGSSTSDSGFQLPKFKLDAKTESSSEQKSEAAESETKTNGSSVSDLSSTSSASKDAEAPKSEGKALFGSTAAGEGAFKIPKSSSSASSASKDEDPDKEHQSYLKQMRHLNESFCKWVSECISNNPECILTPCFDDYTKYVEKIDKIYPCVTPTQGAQKKSSTDLPASFANKDEKDEEPKITSQTDESKKDTKPVFSFVSLEKSSGSVPAFGALADKSVPSATAANREASPKKKEESAFVFGSTSTSTSSGTAFQSKFSFNVGSAGNFSFGTGSAFPGFGQGMFSKPADAKVGEGTSDQTGAAGGEDDDYEPPKAEVVENSEKDAFYTVRCKLYYKKADKFEERGVGFLYLKPNGTKTQLLVRTDTALGNILLNINVEKVMPVSRQGKNNVTVICVPNPRIEPKMDSKVPVPMLIRVKTEEEADKLYKEITDCQAKM